MSMKLKRVLKDMTPRQRCAVVYPIADTGTIPHARHHRRNGGVQSILTFDVAEISSLKGADLATVGRALDGWYAVWHARVSMHPVTHVDDWDAATIENAKGVVMRCVAGVGIDEVEVHNGSDLQSIHVYKWATHEEIQLSAHELLGKGFAELREEQAAKVKAKP